MKLEDRFGALVDAFRDTPGVMVPDDAGGRKFGASTLRANGSIFAMLTGGHLVVKLPRERVQALIDEGTGAAFDGGKGRPMREWLSVVADDHETWLNLAGEARNFVTSRRR